MIAFRINLKSKCNFLIQLSSAGSPHFPHIWTECELVKLFILTSQATSYFGRGESRCSRDKISISKHFRGVEVSGWWVTYKNHCASLSEGNICIFFIKIRLLPFWTQRGILHQLFVKILSLHLEECVWRGWRNVCWISTTPCACSGQSVRRVSISVFVWNLKAPRLKSKIQYCFHRTQE